MKYRRFFLAVGVIVALGAPRSAHGQWLRVSRSEGFHCLATHGANLYAGTGDTLGGGYVVVSSDNGASWRRLDTAGWPKKTKKGLPIVFIVDCLAWNGPNLIAGTNEGVYISGDEGATWTAGAGFAQDPTVYCIAVGKSHLFAGTQRHVLVSADGGLTWAPAGGAGLPGSYVEHLAINGTDLFAGTFSGVWMSKDDGATWTEANNGLPKDRNVSCLATSGSYLLAQISASGFFRSPDGGASWTRAGAGLPANGGVQYLTEIGGKLLAGVSNGGVFASSDHGGTWTAMNAGWPHDRISVNWLSENGGQILAGVFNNNVTGYEIWRWPSAGAAAGGGETAQTYFDNGQRAFQAGDFANAVMLFGKAIERDPKSATAWVQRAWSYVRLGGRSSFDSALVDVAKALELSSADKSVYFLRGEIYRNLAYFALDKKNQPEADALLAKALADYRIALQANPDSPVIPVSIGAASAAKGDLDGALATYAGVFERDPNNQDLTKHLRDVFQLYVERKKEIDCGTFGRTWHQAGRFYEEKREYASAIRCYSRALDLGFTEWSVYWDRAHAYENAGDLAKALADADTLVKIPPPSPHSHSFRAEVRDKMGQLDKAIEDCSEAIRLQWKSIKELDTDYKDVEYLRLRTQRANVYAKKGEWNKAIGDLQYVSDKLRPGAGKANVLRGIGSVYQKKGDARNAQKYFDQAEAMDPHLKKR